jgi:predicted acyltransferase
MTHDISPQASSQRLLSLDFFRGLTMFLLIGKSSHLYHLFQTSSVGFVSFIGFQFEHAAWNGLTFWDFVEPFFMFIVGVAIPFSVLKRLERGDPWKKVLMHALERSFSLFLLGIIYYSVSAGRPVWKLWNVLTQLGFTYLVAFLLMRRPIKVQVAAAFGMLLVSELLYRLFPVEGFNQAFVPGHGFGTWFDLQTMGITDKDYWTAFNAVPTAAFTIWGVVAGLVLRSERTSGEKLRILSIAGLVGIIVGFALDPIDPIIKRIATASYVIETGGWCMVFLALFYWLIDLKKFQKVPKFFAIVGMNCLFIYMMDQFGIATFLTKVGKPFAYAAFVWFGDAALAYGSALLTWFLLWYMCYFLYKNKIIIKV